MTVRLEAPLAGRPLSRGWRWIPLGLGLVAAVALALPAGHASLRAGEYALGAGALLCLSIFGLTDFRLFLATLLACRSVIDVAHGASNTNGPATSGLAESAVAGLFVVLAAIWLVARLRSPARRYPLSSASKGAVALIAACAVSLPASTDLAFSAREGLRLIASLLMVLTVELAAQDWERARRIAQALALAIPIPVGVGLYQGITRHGLFVSADGARVHGTFVHPNTYGFFLALVIVAAVAVIPHVGSWPRIVIGATAAAALVDLVLSLSRGAWIALIAGLIVVGLLQSKRMLLGVIVLCFAAAFAIPTVHSRLQDITNGQTARGTAGNNLAWRLDYWRSLAPTVARNPVSGLGPGMSELVTTSDRPPHNDYLRALVEYGALGLLAYLYLLYGLIHVARTALRRAPPHGLQRGLAVAFAGAVAAFMIDSFGANVFDETVVMWYFLALAAIAVAFSRRATLNP